MSCFTYSTMLLLICSIQFLSIVYLLTYMKGLNTLLQDQDSNPNSIQRKPSTPSLNKLSSSVYCYGKTKKERQCQFTNLCYSKSKAAYLFFHGNTTKMFGLPDNLSTIPALLDLSSVDDHNAMYFHYIDVEASLFNSSVTVSYIEGESILMKRFNPENLMHIIHDDLIPLFYTKKKYYPTKENVNYVFMENREKGPYFELYEMYSGNFLMVQNFSTELTCFKDVVVGVSKETTWYQYGFKVPQGPINIQIFPVSELQYFKEFIMMSSQIRSVEGKLMGDVTSSFVLYISRSVTRKILNESKFIFRLMSYFKVPVKTVNLENDNLFEIIFLISKASVVIGMHGAHFSLAVFMQSTSILIELFPYGIPAVNYTPYKTLCNLKNIKYMSWENHKLDNTVTHEEWPSYLGGIQNLRLTLRDDILKTRWVPQKLCCHDPYWLFRIYQDTIIDLEDLFYVLKLLNITSASILKPNSSSHDNEIYYPTLVTNVICRYTNKHIDINYTRPWNMRHRNHMSYQLLVVQTCDDSTSTQILYEVKQDYLSLGHNANCLYKLAVACKYKHNTSKFSNYINCR